MKPLRCALLAVAVGLAGPAARANDESIFKDWKEEIQKRGIQHSKERGEFWEAKGVQGKDLYWLARIWERAEEYEKAKAAFEGFLKVEGIDEKNKQNAVYLLVGIAMKSQDWAGAIAGAERFRKEFPGSRDIGSVWDEQGRAHRLMGDRDKAVEAFKASAGQKWTTGLVDLVDVYLVEGKIDEAKAAVATAMKIDEMRKNPTVGMLQGFVDAVGTPGPSLEKGCSIGVTPAPTTLTGKPTVLYYWFVKMNWIDDRLTRVRNLEQRYGEKAQVFAVSTYDKYNPNTKKVEEGMTEEQERDIQGQIVKQMTGGGPSALLVPRDVFDALKQKTEGQWTIFDAEGKLRYVRVTDKTPYDWKCVELALRAFAGE
jgi:tetratricopeptide (TPR) repeat protein